MTERVKFNAKLGTMYPGVYPDFGDDESDTHIPGMGDIDALDLADEGETQLRTPGEGKQIFPTLTTNPNNLELNRSKAVQTEENPQGRVAPFDYVSPEDAQQRIDEIKDRHTNLTDRLNDVSASLESLSGRTNLTTEESARYEALAREHNDISTEMKTTPHRIKALEPFLTATPIPVTPREEREQAKRMPNSKTPLTEEQALWQGIPAMMNAAVTQTDHHKCTACDGTGWSGLYSVRASGETKPEPCSSCAGFGHTVLQPHMADGYSGLLDLKTSIRLRKRRLELHNSACGNESCRPQCAFKQVLEPVRQALRAKGVPIQSHHVKLRSGTSDTVKRILADPVLHDDYESTHPALISYMGRHNNVPTLLGGNLQGMLTTRIRPKDIVGFAGHSLEFPDMRSEYVDSMFPRADRAIHGFVDKISPLGRTWDGWLSRRDAEKIAQARASQIQKRREGGRDYELEMADPGDAFNGITWNDNKREVDDSMLRDSLKGMFAKQRMMAGSQSLARTDGTDMVYVRGLPTAQTYRMNPVISALSRTAGTIYGTGSKGQPTLHIHRLANPFSATNLYEGMMVGRDSGARRRWAKIIGDVNEFHDLPREGKSGHPLSLSPGFVASTRSVSTPISELYTPAHVAEGYHMLGDTSSGGTPAVHMPGIDLQQDFNDPSTLQWLREELEISLSDHLNGRRITEEELHRAKDAMIRTGNLTDAQLEINPRMI